MKCIEKEDPGDERVVFKDKNGNEISEDQAFGDATNEKDALKNFKKNVGSLNIKNPEYNCEVMKGSKCIVCNVTSIYATITMDDKVENYCLPSA